MVTLQCCGCGDGRPKRYEVSGKVLIDGQPMQYGVIQVLPEGSRPAAGTIQEDGTFTLGSFSADDGCVPGAHMVAIDGRKSLGPTKVKWFAPKKFAYANTSGVTVTIDKPTDELVIELDSGGRKPFEPFVEVIARGVTDEQIKKGDTVF
jgi:hypothetical protein